MTGRWLSLTKPERTIMLDMWVIFMDCEFENICETCAYFTTGLEFRPTLIAQRADACAKGQTRRATIYDRLIAGLDTTEAS